MRQRSAAVAGGIPILMLFLVLGARGPMALAGELPPDHQAMLVLNAARKAYNEQNYPFAADRFRDFLRQFGGHKEAVSAQYGLALALIEGPAKDYRAAAEALGQAVGRDDFADKPFALQYQGMAFRGLGYQELAEAQAKPQEAQDRRNRARQNFEEAVKRFAGAAAAFAARANPPPPVKAPPPAEAQPPVKAAPPVKAPPPAEAPPPVKAAPPVKAPPPAEAPPPVKAPPPADAPLPDDLEWAGRARCDQAEMLLRLDKFKEAEDLTSAFVADAAMAKSRYRPLALYHQGYAKFAQRDYLAAGKALSQLAPFQQEYGVHARYLLARTHHLAGERGEAGNQYKAVVTGCEEQKKAAQEALKNPAALPPGQKDLLEGLLRNPPPDYVLRATFYLGLLLAEEGKFAEALERFNGLVAQFPKSAVAPEAQLRQGFCQMQLRNYPEAIKALQPLAEHPQLGDQALWWLARSQAAAADPNNAQAYEQALRGAIETLRRAAERAQQLAARNDPDAKIRRGDILLESADTQLLAKMYREAAATYQQVLAENNNPDRAEEAMQRQATALHLATQFRESDEVCKKFEEKFPKSTLLAAVLFRTAENAYLVAAAAAGRPDAPPREELNKLFGEALTRYQRLLKQCPDFPYVSLARQGMALAHYRLGQYAEAIPVLTAIPEPDRTGELAIVPYLLADCLIRTLPPEAEDAVGAARLVDQVERAAKLLDGFIGAQGKSPQAPDAHLKLAYCYQRIGAVLAEPPERQKVLTQARELCEKALQQFPQDPAMPSLVFERAKVLALLGDVNGASNELRRFRADPLKNSPVAPLAAVRLSALTRTQNKAAEAVTLMAEVRSAYEGNLQKDPVRADWIPVLQYEHALAVKESGKLPEARGMFEELAKKFAGRPEAVNAQWRAGQCRREELVAAIAAARATLAKPGAKAEELAAAKTSLENGFKDIAKTVEFLQGQADELGKKAGGSEPHLQALYELAWCHRTLAEAEVEAARAKLQQEGLEKARAKAAKETPAGQTPPPVRAPEIPLAATPEQPAEKAATDHYARLIAAAPDSALAIRARLELAELRTLRGKEDDALLLLADALEKNPTPDMAERIRLRAASIFLAKGNPDAALPHIQAVAKNAGSPFAGEARYLMGEFFLAKKDWGKAIEQLVPFRDQGPFQNIPGVSDRALLRLGHALAQAGQWDQARTAYEACYSRFNQSPWADEAGYQLGFALQAQKQFDPAVQRYAEVTRRTVSVFAAKAQLQIGLCRLEQKNFPEAAKALLVVPFTYDYPELDAPAFCHAAQAYIGLNQPAEAARLWQRVVRDFPNTDWAKAAQQGLAGIK